MVIAAFLPLIVLVIVIGIIFAVVMAVKSGSKESFHNEGGENVIRNIYVYLVLFATLMMAIGGSVASFMSIADLVAPAPYYQSYDDFRRWEIDGQPENQYDEERKEQLTEEKLRERYDQIVEEEVQKQRNSAKNSLIKSLGWIIIPGGIFTVFQKRLAKSSHKN